MKTKVTSKQLKEGYEAIISVGYCSAWYLLKGLEPRYYNSGVYGWNYDAYHIDNSTLITTGYRPIGNLSCISIVNKYNEKARKIYNSDLEYNKKITKINKLLDKFILEVKEIDL